MKSKPAYLGDRTLDFHMTLQIETTPTIPSKGLAYSPAFDGSLLGKCRQIPIPWMVWATVVACRAPTSYAKEKPSWMLGNCLHLAFEASSWKITIDDGEGGCFEKDGIVDICWSSTEWGSFIKIQWWRIWTPHVSQKKHHERELESTLVGVECWVIADSLQQWHTVQDGIQRCNDPGTNIIKYVHL